MRRAAKFLGMSALWTLVLACAFAAGEAHAQGSLAWMPLLGAGMTADFVYELFRYRGDKCQ